MRVVDISGMTFGRLTVVERRGSVRHGNGAHALWLCRCSCGIEKLYPSHPLRSGRIVSCGCARTERIVAISYLHGRTGTRTHNIWRGMLKRCECATTDSYERYGGRGIVVCERWQSFSNFLADMGDAPKGYSIERINNDGNYEPGNCEWIPRRHQGKNTSRSKRLTYLGRTQILSDWARELDVPVNRLADRLGKLGWSVERALSTREKLLNGTMRRV